MNKYRSGVNFALISRTIILLAGFFSAILAVNGQVNDATRSLGTPVMPIFVIPAVFDEPPPGSSTCPNSNFSSGTFDSWEGCYGSFFPNTCTTPGFLTTGQHPLHKIIATPGWVDANTNCPIDGLITAYPGEDFVARIGDTMYTGPAYANPKAAELKYPISVTTQNNFFIYRYAVVLQSGGHDLEDQPDFLVVITDTSGNELDTACGKYHFTAPKIGPAPPGWNKCGSDPNALYWKNWATIGMDLSDYVGQTVYIRFKVQGCVYQTHYGYAYVSAFCSKMSIDLAGCEGSGSVTMTGPPGFAGYEWTGPGPTGPIVGTSQICTVTAAQGAVTGATFYLKLTAVNGCVLEKVMQTVAFTSVAAGFSSVINCVGNVSSFTDTSTSTNPSQLIERRKWRFEAGDPYTPETTNPTINHTFTTTGPHEVTMISFSTDDCSDTLTQIVNVGPPPVFVNLATGQPLCSGDNANITIYLSQAGAYATWTTTVTSGTATITTNPPSQSGTLIDDVIVNAGPGDAVVTYSITPRIGDCLGVPVTYEVTVHPLPGVGPISNQVFCNNQPVLPTTVSGPVTGATYAWTNSNTNIGLAANGTGDISAFTATNVGSAPITATISMVATANLCPGPASTYTIIVNPTPTVTAIPDQVFCNNQSVPSTPVTGPVTGATYTWTNSNTLIGLAAGGNGNIAAFTAVNTGLTPVSATVTITPHYSNATLNCDGPPVPFIITVNPTAEVDQPASQVICNSDPIVAINFTTDRTGGTTTYSWTNSAPGIGLPGTGNGNIVVFAALNNGTAPVVATIIVTPHFENGSVICDGPTKTFTITVNPTAQVDLPASQVICNSGTTSAINFTTNRTGGTTTYTWTNDLPAIGLPGAGNGNIAGFIAANPGMSPIIATIGVTPHFENGTLTCIGPPKTFTITVNPTAQLDQPASQVLCNGILTTAINFTTDRTGGTTTYSWTNSNPAIGLTGTGTGNINPFTAINNGASPVIATIVVTPHFENGSVVCDGPTKTFTLTVNPTAQADQPTSQVRCNGQTTNAINFTTDRTGGTTTYTWTNNLPGIGLPGSGNGNIAAFTTVNGGTSPAVATLVVTPHFENGSISCDGPTKTFTITVNPTAEADQPASQVVCNGNPTSPVNFTTPNTGGTPTFSWTNNTPAIGLPATGNGNITSFSASNSGSAPVIATIAVTPHFENGTLTCDGPSKSFTITVNPTAEVDQPAGQVLCNGGTSTAINFTTNRTGGTTTFTWTNDLPGIGLAVSGSGSIGTFSTVNNGTAPVVATIAVTPHFENGTVTCDGPSKLFTITVNPTAEADQPTSQVKCNGAFTDPVNFTTNRTGGTTIYTWTNDVPGIGLAASGSGPIGTFSSVNNGNAPVIATITVTPHFENGTVSCDGPAKSFTITVNPTADVDQPSGQALCNGELTGAVNFTTNRTGGTTTYAWTNDTPGIGLSGSGNGNIAAFTAVNGSTTPAIATIVVTPYFENGAVTCIGPAKTFTITVNPTAEIDQPANLVICNAFLTPLISFTTPNSGGTTTYTWTNSTTSIGLAGNGTGNIAAFTAINTGTAPVVATIIVTPHFQNGSVTCDGLSKTFSLTVNPTAAVDQPASQVVCNGTQPAAIAFTTATSGGAATYTWTNNAPGIGLAGSGTGNIAGFTALNPGASPVVATIVVTPHFENGTVICDGPSKTFSITVNPTAAVDQPSSSALCHNSQTSAITFTTTNLGGTTTYTWTNDTPGIGLAGSGTGNIAAFNAINAGTLPVVATIVVTPHFSNASLICDGPAKTFTITVNPLPVPSITGAASVCAGTTGLMYNTEPGNSAYQWTISGGGNITAGLTTKEITVTWNTIGPQLLTVNYVDANGCTAPAPSQFSVNVQNLPTPTITGSQAVCVGTTSTYTTENASSYIWGIPMAGGNYSGGGSADNFLTMTWLNPGSYDVTVNYTVGSTGCTAVAPTHHLVVVNPNPTPQITGPLTPICGFSTQTYSTAGSGHVYQWTPTGGTIVGGGAASTINIQWGNVPPVTVNLTETINYPGVSCSTVATTFPVSFKPWPSAPDLITGPSAVCITSTYTFSVTPIPNATSHQWVYSGTGANIAGNGTSSISITFTPSATNGNLTVTGNNDCGNGPASLSFNITVNPLPVVTYTSCNEVITTLNGKKFILNGGMPLLLGIPSQEGYTTVNGVAGNNPIEIIGGKYYFNPMLLSSFETGVYPITYHYTNQYGCTATSVLNPASYVTVIPGNGTFACGTLFTDPRDLSGVTKYSTVMIGAKCWMQENLRYGSNQSYTSPQTNNCTWERFCLSTDNANCSLYGGMYQWDELMQYDGIDKGQGFCPPGWHVPNETEWDNMITFVSGGIGNGVAGSYMKDMNLPTSFRGFPAGIFYLNDLQSFFNATLKATFYWTSTYDAATKKAVARGLNTKTPSVSRYESSKANAFPVRCVKD